MGRGRIFIYLALIMILGLVALAVVWTRLNPAGGGQPVVPTPTPIEQVTVVVTTQRIPRGGELTQEVTQEISIPRDLLLEGMFTNQLDVVGFRAKFDLDSGIPLTRNMLVETVEQLSAAGSVAALLIPRGMVAVSVPISRLSSVSFGLERGDQVNVIVTFPFVDLDADYQSELPNVTSAVLAPGPNVLLTVEGADAIDASLVESETAQNLAAQSATGGAVSPQGRVELDPNLGQPFYIVPSEPQRPRLVSQTLIQGAIVLQMGTFPLPGEEEEAEQVEAAEEVVEEEAPAQQPPPGEEAPVEEGPEPPDVITLIVSPQDAVTLNYLIFGGAQLSLAMRAAEDDSRAETEAVTLQFLLDQYEIPVPAKLPFGIEPRVDELIPPVLQNDIPPAPTQQ